MEYIFQEDSMLDYKDIIIKHYGGGMSGSELAAAISAGRATL